MKTTKSRVPSSQVTSRTVKTRSQELDQHRKVCSGGDQGFQLGHEVKSSCSTEEREKILEELQGGFKVVMPTTLALGMKAELGIPWSKLRAIRK